MQRPWRRALSVRLSIHLVFGAALPAHACWDDAAQRYQVSSALLYAIARTESGLNPLAINRNGNGSRDIGLMQINSAWLPTLAAHGINERDLFEPCTNIHVGAWILAGNVSRLGYTWDAVGAYNATRPALRRAYIEKVRRHLPAALPASAPPARRMTFASLR
jgi:soluble lytic murein transglycosylase-like protein